MIWVFVGGGVVVVVVVVAEAEVMVVGVGTDADAAAPETPEPKVPRRGPEDDERESSWTALQAPPLPAPPACQPGDEAVADAVLATQAIAVLDPLACP